MFQTKLKASKTTTSSSTGSGHEVLNWAS